MRLDVNAQLPVPSAVPEPTAPSRLDVRMIVRFATDVPAMTGLVTLVMLDCFVGCYRILSNYFVEDVAVVDCCIVGTTRNETL